MKIKVLHLRDTFEIGGPGKTIIETFSHINKKKFDIEIGVFLTYNESIDSPFITEALNRNIKTHFIRGINQYDPIQILRLINLLKKENIHILHTHETKSDIIGFLATRFHKIPIVTTIHGWINNSTQQKIYSRIDNRIIKKFDRVLVVNERMKSELFRDKNNNHNVNVLHNAIVIENYLNNNKNKVNFENLLGCSIPRPIIVTIGRLSYEKGQKDFIDAAERVLKKGFKASFLLIGDGPYRSYLQNIINKKNLNQDIIFTGYLRNLNEIYQNFNLMVLPSYTEGMPNVILESMISRVPVIATDVGGVSEIVKNNFNGILIPPKHPEIIAEKIIEFIKYPNVYQKMVENAFYKIKESFNFKLRTEKLEKIYFKVFHEFFNW